MASSLSEIFRWVERAAEGDQRAWTALLDACQGRLERMVSLRIDPRFRGRVDAADVIQEACVDAFQRLAEYRDNPEVPFHVWLRRIAKCSFFLSEPEASATAGRPVADASGSDHLTLQSS